MKSRLNDLSSVPFVVAVALASLLIAGCAARQNPNVKTDFDPDIDFSSYVTYQWLAPPKTTTLASASKASPEHPFEANTLVDKRVRRAVDDELKARGYKPTGGSSPDFQLRYRLEFDDPTDDDAGRRRPDRYDRGILFLDIIDARTQRMSWRGWTRDTNRSGYFRDEQLRESVADILSAFPPPGVEPPSDEDLLRRRVQELEAQLNQK